MAYIYDLSDTWNAGGTTFYGIRMNVTNTASAAGSRLLSLQVSGSELFGVDVNGNVGIGTASPATKLDVQGYITSGNITVRGDGVEGGQITFNNSSNTDGPIFLDVDSSGHGRLFTATNNTNITLGQLVGTGGNVVLATGSAERLRISANGNVGIGTSAPTCALDVAGHRMRLRTASAPASASDTGSQGEICWDSGYIYVCIGTNTWKRAALATW